MSESSPTGGQSASGQAASGKPGRYERSPSALVGAMIILLVVMGAYVAFRAVTRDQPDLRPEAVDYLNTVAVVQKAGREAVYPESLPAGWIATRTVIGEAPDEDWGVNMLTEDGSFAGVRLDADSLDVLLSAFVDEKPTEGDAIDVPGAIEPRWRMFTDEGGDTAYAAERETGAWLIVYGSAGSNDLLELIGSLTDAPAASDSSGS